MPFEVDPQFQTRAQASRLRKRRRLGLRIGAGFVGCAVVSLAAWMFLRSPAEVSVATAEIDPEQSFGLVQSEETAEAAVALERFNSFVDLRRDPMILRFGDVVEGKTRVLAVPEGAVIDRLDAAQSVTGLRDSMFVAERRLITTLPSSHDDFALFKAQRSQGFDVMTGAGNDAPVRQGRLVSVDEASSWGDLVSPDAVNAAVYIETEIENTTSAAVTKAEARRDVLFEDEIIVLRAARAVQDVLVSAGISDGESAAVMRALALEGSLEAESIVALRKRPDQGAGQVMQLSIYGPEGYLTSLAQVGAGRFEKAADPWVGSDLMARSGEPTTQTQPPGEVRLLDALYSAAIRNGMPTKLIGEMIVLMSQHYDLERFAAEGDDLVVLRGAGAGMAGLGEILYVGIHTNAGVMPCYVLSTPGDQGFDCFDFKNPAATRRGRDGLGGGFVVPVEGVKTSGFGPRHHPILKQVRNHNGVDWAAPIGTPVVAAAGATVRVAGAGGGYGNVVYLDHGNGVETRYAHLNGFADGVRKGSKVSAGDVIGFVGTTGRSTGPHLHFELWVGGRPVDPLTYRGGGGGTQAVEALVDQIIRVESGGVATAKNPLSTATGLGQFIESTWLRMMREYRADLTLKMDRSQLLALRNDPAISREMVRHLARENEAFLRARGHEITAGRLYLAHFLGPAGANTALRADAQATVLSVMGRRVVDANPFLRGKQIADLHAWSDRKMRRSGRPTPISARIVPPEAVAYRKAIDALLSQM